MLKKRYHFNMGTIMGKWSIVSDPVVDSPSVLHVPKAIWLTSDLHSLIPASSRLFPEHCRWGGVGEWWVLEALCVSRKVWVSSPQENFGIISIKLHNLGDWVYYCLYKCWLSYKLTASKDVLHHPNLIFKLQQYTTFLGGYYTYSLLNENEGYLFPPLEDTLSRHNYIALESMCRWPTV